MRILEVSIRGFRCFDSDTFTLCDFTVLIGRNSSGKSTIIRALQHFYDVGARVDSHDFHGGWKEGDEIEIGVVFADLTPEEIDVFGRHVRDGHLRVAKVYSQPDAKGTYFGLAMQVEEFAALRHVKGKDFNKLYSSIRESFGMPATRSQADGEAELKTYESEHPGECTPQREEVQFLGAPNVGGGILDKYTGFIFVPAVREAHDVAEGKEGPIADLIKRIVVPKIEDKEDLKEFKKNAEEQLRKIFEDSNKSDLPALGRQITSLLDQYAPGAAMKLWWDEVQPPTLRFPEVNRHLLDDGWSSPVGRVGHGLQRSLVMALLQLEAETREQQAEDWTPDSDDGDGSVLSRSVILAIEEPELYLHPSRCRHLAAVLLKLAERDTQNFQILCATHSPHFLDLSRFPNMRLVRKHQGDSPDGPMTSRVKECDADGVAAMLASATEADKPEAFTGDTMLAALRRILHPNPSVTEGFFASVAVLVEGETDFGVLVELARIRDLPWERLGVVVVPCGGKRSIDRPALVFREVGIPIFVLFDGDKKQGVKKQGEAAASSRLNRTIQRICGVDAPVDWPTGLAKDHPFAAFEDRIEDYFKERLGDAFEKALTKVSSELGFVRDRTFNTREGAARVMRELSSDDLEKLIFLDEVVRAITTLAEETAKTPTAPDVQAARTISLDRVP